MQKEMIISILIGLFFGLIIVYGVYTAHVSLSKPNSSPDTLTTNANETTKDSQLVIHSPEDETITNEPLTTITGTTLAKSYVVIFINDQELITNADDAGHFSIEGELELGSNIIQVQAIDEEGQVLTEERTLIYTTKPLIETPTEVTSASESSTINSGDNKPR